jgi:hypothetical protein
MAEKDEIIDPALQHLDDHYGDVVWQEVPEPKASGPGLTPAEARKFLRGLRPVQKAVQKLGEVAKKKG